MLGGPYGKCPPVMRGDVRGAPSTTSTLALLRTRTTETSEMEYTVFEDESRWMVMSSRFETDGLVKQMLDEMMEEWVESLPPDNPARLLYYMLPKPPA
jgi:hypothetical protein